MERWGGLCPSEVTNGSGSVANVLEDIDLRILISLGNDRFAATSSCLPQNWRRRKSLAMFHMAIVARAGLDSAFCQWISE